MLNIEISEWPYCPECLKSNPSFPNKTCLSLGSNKCFIHTWGYGWYKRLKIFILNL